MSATQTLLEPEQLRVTLDNKDRRARRVVFVIEALTVGGAERMVVDLANEFVERGDSVSVVCLSAMGELAASLSNDVTLYLLNKKPGIDLGVIGRLRRLLIKLDVDVVNSHLWTANLWTRLALIKAGIPVVATEHNRDVWKRPHNKMIDKVLSRATALLVAVSEDTASFYRDDIGINANLIRVVNNGVDTQRYASGDGRFIRNQLAKEHELLIGTVGRLAEQKNHPRLVDAAAILKQRGLPFQVVIAGDGPEKERTQAHIDNCGVSDCVTLLGERSDIPDLLAALDLFVLSSDREGHPLSALEAQSAGAPVVLTNAGGSADAISSSTEGCGGLLVQKSAEALADAIATLENDRPRLNLMAQFASSFALQHYDKRTMVNKYSDVFNDVISSQVAQYG